MGKSYTLEGNRRDDGMVRFTCADLPGFRLLLKESDSKTAYEAEVKDALKVFVPLYVAAEARNKVIDVSRPHGVNDEQKGNGFKLVAHLAPA